MQCINAKKITIFLYLHDVKIIFFQVFIFLFFAIEKLQVWRSSTKE